MKLAHTMILASAGSGKTYALTDRFVALLAAGASPERIVALTFTRKAAGEFFDEILRKLARAAADARYAARLAADIDQPQLGCLEFLRLLRTTTDAMHRLRLGTLDGFFARIARAFPLELGLSGEFEVLQEHSARMERRRVLQRMFARATDGLDAAQREFIEAFKRATFGTEEKRLAARLDGFLDEHHDTFLAAPSPALWGDKARVWPDGSEWLAPPAKKIADAIAGLRAQIARRALPEKQLARWEAFFAAVAEWTPGAPLSRAITYLLENALDVWADVRRGAAEITVERKKMTLEPEECADLAVIVRWMFAAELTRHLETTRGIHAVIRAYEAVYHDAVRRSGRLTFGDVQRLLQPGDDGPRFASEVDSGEGRLMIDFRLDGRFDHWLLDEFQDTSFGQWSVLENLIDEVVQDPTGARTFFCVGDVKQAIYTWREGDPRLFREIHERYNAAAPGGIVERHLVKSWRSSPPIIEMVNAVFGNGAALAEILPGPASADWNREWRPHESAHPALSGQAAWLHADEEAARFSLTVQLLLEIAPLERGLDCAVLTQTNATATALAEFLRREGGIPALADSDLRIATDNPLGAALLALAQAAAHPGDTLAQRHIAMTPLRAALEAEGVRSPEELTRRLLGQIHAEGFERAMDFWVCRVLAGLPESDLFNHERARQFVAGAALFDATGSRDAAEFVAFMSRHVIRGVETAGVVRVMTIHKSKGLGFDVVVLPDLEGQSIDQRRAGLAVQRAPDRTPEWVLDLPPKLFVDHDEVLHAHVRAAEAVAGQEALSLLYVALTRAKRAMYVITKPPGATRSRNYPRLLGATLGDAAEPIAIGGMVCSGARAWGDAQWHEKICRSVRDDAEPESKIELLHESTAPRAHRRRARRPSAEHGGILEASRAFALDGAAAVEFGLAVHGLLAAVEWGDAVEHLALGKQNLPRAAVIQAEACLAAPALARVWKRVAGAEVWRERAFELLLDGAWVTGVFDRVVLERDGTGRVARLTVYEFKTDRLPNGSKLTDLAARHAGQVRLYCRAAAVLAGVPWSSVEGVVVFTSSQQMVSVTPA